MSWKKHSIEEISRKLGGVRAAVDAGAALNDAIESAGISPATYFRWRARYGELFGEDISLVRKLELENARLRRALKEMESIYEMPAAASA